MTRREHHRAHTGKCGVPDRPPRNQEHHGIAVNRACEEWLASRGIGTAQWRTRAQTECEARRCEKI